MPVEQEFKPAASDSLTIPKEPFLYSWFISKKRRRLGVILLVLITLWDLSMIFQPLMLQRMVDGLTAGVSTAEQLAVLWQWGIALLVLYVFVYLFGRGTVLTSAYFLSHLNKDSALFLTDYLSKHSHGYFINRQAGSIADRVGNASNSLESFLNGMLWQGYSKILSMFFTMIVLGTVNIYLALVFLVSVVIVGCIDYRMVKNRRQYIKDVADANARVGGVSIDMISNIQTVRQHARQKVEMETLSEAHENRFTKNIIQVTKMMHVIVLNNIVVLGMLAATLVALYVLLSQGALTAGEIVLVLLLLGNVTREINSIGQAFNNIARQYGLVKSGLEAILVPHEIVDEPEAAPLTVSAASIDWCNVTFSFGTNQVFQDFNLTIKPGERVGLVGPSGAGKTTFVSLLLRQHELDQGEIVIADQNIAHVTQDSLREQIAVVPQEPLLFHRSIRDNIAYGKPTASKSDIRGVAAKAQALDFILDLPDKFDTLVGERGVKLSGGQKQRVAIARAMLKDAPILVLDEATSALDSESEVAIQKALHELMTGKTVVAIAHRLSTLREMDRIIVLDQGQIVEDGTHESLSQAGGVYQRLWEHQAGGFLQE